MSVCVCVCLFLYPSTIWIAAQWCSNSNLTMLPSSGETVCGKLTGACLTRRELLGLSEKIPALEIFWWEHNWRGESKCPPHNIHTESVSFRSAVHCDSPLPVLQCLQSTVHSRATIIPGSPVSSFHSCSRNFHSFNQRMPLTVSVSMTMCVWPCI